MYKELFNYNINTGIFDGVTPTKNITAYQELVENDELVFKAGYTDDKPEGMALYPGVSPKRVESVWVEELDAIAAWEASKPVDEKATLQTTDELIELMLKANTLEELHNEIITIRFGAIPR